MSNTEIVQLLLVIVGLFFVAFEVFTNMNDVEDDTTNVILYQATLKRMLFIPFAIGAIAGHLFLGTTSKLFPSYNIITAIDNELLVIMGLAVISGLLVLFSKRIKTRSREFLTVLLLAGLLYGHFFWSMND
ncbi:MAG TPA: hypothetical protein PK275_09985 [Chitinophagaceae bacterium]|nr:hypothetical protein [Chitinophagaceae bacterium]